VTASQKSSNARPISDPASSRVSLDVVRGQTQPALHRATAHDHLLGRGRLDESVRLGRVDAHEDPALAARGDGHVAVHEEREAAEHRLLGHAGLAGDEVANARRERFVVCHRPRY
jgi:hypothetical protein